MYYLIERSYVGPNTDQNIDFDDVVITTAIPKTNMSKEARVEGWCGTTNDVSITAHGEYETVDAARKAINEKFGPVRSCDTDEVELDGDTVGVYKKGAFTPLDKESTQGWAYDEIVAEVSADTSEEQIEALIKKYETYANGEGFSLDEDALEEMINDRISDCSE